MWMPEGSWKGPGERAIFSSWVGPEQSQKFYKLV